MTVLSVPYHVDEYLPDLDLPLRASDVVRADFPSGDAWARLALLYGLVADAVADAAGRGARPAVLAGDCLTALGTMAGLQRAGIDPGIVWFDAHGDVQTPETSASGYLPGMSLRLLAGYRPELIAAPLGLRPVPEDKVVLVGARDLDPPESAYLADARIQASAVRRRPACGRQRRMPRIGVATKRQTLEAAVDADLDTLATAIWHNDHAGQPAMRSLIAYDH